MTMYDVFVFQHGGVRSAVYATGHHGRRNISVPRQSAPLEEEVW